MEKTEKPEKKETKTTSTKKKVTTKKSKSPVIKETKKEDVEKKESFVEREIFKKKLSTKETILVWFAIILSCGLVVVALDNYIIENVTYKNNAEEKKVEPKKDDKENVLDSADFIGTYYNSDYPDLYFEIKEDNKADLVASSCSEGPLPKEEVKIKIVKNDNDEEILTIYLNQDDGSTNKYKVLRYGNNEVVFKSLNNDCSEDENTIFKKNSETSDHGMTNSNIKAMISKIEDYKLFNIGYYNPGGISINVNNVDEEVFRSLYYYKTFDVNEELDGMIITKAEVDNYFKEAFGFTPNKYIDITCPLDNVKMFIYDKSTQKYTYNNDDNHGHGGIPSMYKNYYITDYKEDGNTYEISGWFLVNTDDVGYTFEVGDNDFSDMVYKDCDDICKSDADLYYQYSLDAANLFFNKYLDEVQNEKEYTFRFKKNSGNFYLIYAGEKK